MKGVTLFAYFYNFCIYYYTYYYYIYRFFGPGVEQKIVEIKERAETPVSHYSCGTTFGSSEKSEIFSMSEFLEPEKTVGYCTSINAIITITCEA